MRGGLMAGWKGLGELLCQRHAGVVSFAGADVEFSRGIIPADACEGEIAIFIAVAIAGVFVECEMSIGTGVDAQFDGLG